MHRLLIVHCSVDNAITCAIVVSDDLLQKGDPDLSRVEALRCLGEELDHLQTMTSSQGMLAIDGGSKNLHKAVTYFREWAVTMRVFYNAACDALMNQMCTALTARATELRGTLADWKAFITDEAINDVMVRSDVLGNKHRPPCNAKAKELSDVLTRAEEASKCLKITPPFEEDKRTSGAKALADSAVARTYETMMITAAANAVYNFGEKPQGPAMATKALAIIDEQEKFALPRSLREKLEALKVKVVEKPSAAASSTTLETTASDPNPKQKKKSKTSAAAAGVKKEAASDSD